MEAPCTPMLQALSTHVTSPAFLHSSLEAGWAAMEMINFILWRERMDREAEGLPWAYSALQSRAEPELGLSGSDAFA